jgi:hypothetical protein
VNSRRAKCNPANDGWAGLGRQDNFVSYTVQEAEQANLDRINKQKDKSEVGGASGESEFTWGWVR